MHYGVGSSRSSCHCLDAKLTEKMFNVANGGSVDQDND